MEQLDVFNTEKGLFDIINYTKMDIIILPFIQELLEKML